MADCTGPGRRYVDQAFLGHVNPLFVPNILIPGNLYVTQTPDDNSSNLSPVSWELPSITSENWVVNGSYVNGTSAGSLTLKPDDGYAVGLMSLANATKTNDTYITGFALFATQLVYNNNTQLEAQFWAAPTDTDGIYSLVWLTDGATPATDSFPVVVKGTENS